MLERELHRAGRVKAAVCLEREALQKVTIARLPRNPRLRSINLASGQYPDLWRLGIEIRYSPMDVAVAQFHEGAIPI